MSGTSNGESKASRTRMSNGAVRPMYNDDAFNSDLDSPVEESTDVVMRVGKDYQAKVPELCRDIYDTKHEALLVWQPCTQKVSNEQVDEFCRSAKERHKYSEEQALGMLFWHKHDVDKALNELANFAPFPDEWSTEDKVLFEQAFSYHGKSFHRIREMLPDKSIAALVKYYYGWKKVRGKTSVMDKQVKQAPVSDLLSDLSDESDDEMSDSSETNGTGPKCDNCSSTSSTVRDCPPNGKLCLSCNNYIKRTGLARPFALFKRNSEKGKDGLLMPQRFNPTKNRKRPPKGIYMDEADLKLMAAGGGEHQNAMIENVKTELIMLKSQVQRNKQHVNLLKGSVQESIEEYKAADELQLRASSRWSQDELLLAVQGVRHFGKDFQAISQMLGSKNTTQVRAFFSSYRKRYNLDGALADYEANKILLGGEVEPMDEDEDDDIIPLAPPPLLKVPSSPTRSPSTKGRSSPHIQTKGRASPKPKTNGAQFVNTASAKVNSVK